MRKLVIITIFMKMDFVIFVKPLGGFANGYFKKLFLFSLEDILKSVIVNLDP